MSKVDQDKIEKQLIRLRSKLESTFRQAQTLHDMIKGLSDPKVQGLFITGSRAIDWKRYEKILDEIVDLELELNSAYIPNYEPLTSYETLRANILIALDKIKVESDETLSSTPKEPGAKQPIKVSHNLPPINISSFSGQIQDWPRFRDLFTSLIIDNDRLTKIEKLHYLVSSVTDRASELIKNYPLAESNFELAWNTLKDRYDSNRVLAAYYFEELSRSEFVPQKPTLESLQRFFTKVNDSVIGLKSMNLDNLSEFLFFSIAIKQLDPQTRKDFEAQHKSESFPTFESLITFVKNECRLLEITNCLSTGNSFDKNLNKQKSVNKTYSPRRNAVLMTYDNPTPSRVEPSSKQIKCPLCQCDHYLYHCTQFISLSVSDRHSLVKKRFLCFNCMGSHLLKNCKSTRNCPRCGQRHHRLLHIEAAQNSNYFQSKQDNRPNRSHSNIATMKTATMPASTVTNVEPAPALSPHSEPINLATRSLNNNTSRRATVLLGTACAHIKNKQNKFVKFRLVIDCASTVTFITKNLVERLGLQIKPKTQEICGLSSTPVGSSPGSVLCTIKPIGSTKPQLVTNALVIDNILHSLPSADLPASISDYFNYLELADPEFYKSQPCDLLLGLDMFPSILVGAESSRYHPDLGTLATVFGHIILGPLYYKSDPSPPQSCLSLATYPIVEDVDELHKQVSRFWEVENILSQPVQDPSHDFCENHFMSTHRRDFDGRYIVEMPFSSDPHLLEFPKSRDVALQRFYSLETRFRRNPALKKACLDFLDEYKLLGHMKKADRPGRYYIPYFCVFSPLSPTTPVRVVFDGSARTTHLSLNQVLLPGPKLQHDVPDVLMNFRLHPFVFTCDISKMYRQILIDDQQCSFLHILFREDPASPLEEFELRTVTYGLSPSSYLAHRTLIQLTRDEGSDYPLASAAILENTCVDDILTGSNSVSGLIILKNQLTELLAKGGFSLNKWSSNSPPFLSSLQPTCAEFQSSLVIRSTDDHSIKVLGLGWSPESDCFFYMLDPPPFQNTYTKRQVLSSIAKFYDPLGFLSPMIFHFKCILKEIWLSGAGWDDPIPDFLCYEWQKCVSQISDLKNINIPRCIFPSHAVCCHLLGFSDGSLKGSAAALYLRVQYLDNSVKLFLLKSKSRVAPTKVQTIPRLELIGAHLLSQLFESIQSFLHHIVLPPSNIYFFTDSTIVLSWLRKSPHLLKIFISNRVSAILEKTNISQWHHITTELNISDVASRGLTPQQLALNTAWFEGPLWAYQPPAVWPLSALTIVPDVELPEIKLSVLVTRPRTTSPSPPDWIYKFSSFSKLQRVTAYLLRFISNSRLVSSDRNHGPLSVAELRISFALCIKCDQKYNFEQDIRSLSSSTPCSGKIQALSPFIDSEGILRVGGRLTNSNLPFNEKHPILLYNESPLTHLIISHYHKLYLHAGPRTLSAILARRFWILNSRRTIRKIIYKCVRCARFRLSVTTPPMGNLPTDRVTPHRPFLNCSVDLAGPYTLRESLRRNARTFKGYFALFICFSVKAVHIEVLTSLSSDCFIAAMHRFVSRRGLPASIYCDQATNFKGASRQLTEIVQFLRCSTTSDIIKEQLASQGIQFKFSVPRAPHMNGLAESNIKNIKYHFVRSIGHQVLTLEEFSTVTTRIEAILNSRPLCALSASPDELNSLTPGHFLTGTHLLAVPEEDLNEVPQGRLSRWQLVQQISNTMWRRWEQEYLHTLQNKGKWFDPSSNLLEGQLVWIKEDNTPPLSYPLGRIVAVHPGSDGVVRAVTVRTKSGIYKRPTRKMAPLPHS